MGMIKGAKEYQKYKNGERLTRRQAIIAQCFICNGEEEANHDCNTKLCPLYQYHPYHGRK
jgi:hypothetical protein